MKVILIGASGKIGKEINAAITERHEVIKVGATSGDIRCDYTDEKSVQAMFKRIQSFDALIAVAGRDSIFKEFTLLENEDFQYGFDRKFLAQIRLMYLGQSYINDGGSFTLTSGFLSDYPNAYSLATGPFNAAVDTFVQNIASMLPRDIRANVVSPAPIVEPGREGRGLITAKQCAEYYVGAIEGNMTGELLRAWGGLPKK